jgi:hypothetical protein
LFLTDGAEAGQLKQQLKLKLKIVDSLIKVDLVKSPLSYLGLRRILFW